MPLLSAAEKRKNIGRLLAKGVIQPWVIPISAQGNLYHHRCQPLKVVNQWFTPTARFARGGLRIDNPGSNPVTIPTETVWWDETGRSYSLTELAVVPPKGTKFVGVVAREPGNHTYTGRAWATNWPDYDNPDEDDATISILHGNTTFPAGEGEDESDVATCMALDVGLDVQGGSFQGQSRLVVRQKDKLTWSFHPQESLGGFQVMTERLSGYVFHRLNLHPIVQFPTPQVITLKSGTITITFIGIEPEESA
jgi:hypothetical protein